MADRGFCQWAQFKWNVIAGCLAASSGCTRCWAALESHRSQCAGSKLHTGLTEWSEKGNMGWTFTGKGIFREDMLSRPKLLKSRLTVWVGPASDLFYEAFTLAQIAMVYAVMAECQQHDFFVLTKRVSRQLQLYTDGSLKAAVEEQLGRPVEWPLRNVRDGISIEDNKMMKLRMEPFMALPSHFKFLSMQPVLEGLELSSYLEKEKNIKWAIIGNEAGPLARKTDPKDIIGVKRQLDEAGIRSLTMCYPL